MEGKSTCSRVLTREVGIGSRPQDFELLFLIIFATSSIDTGEKEVNFGQAVVILELSIFCLSFSRSSRMLEIYISGIIYRDQ